MMTWERKTFFRGHAIVLFTTALLLPMAAPPSARATQTASDAEAETAAKDAALGFVGRFDESDLGGLYDEELAPVFKALMARDYFVQQGNSLRLQSGGKAVGREFVGAQHFTQTPTGQTGSFYWVRYRTRHPNGLVYEDVTVQKVDGNWKVMGFNTVAAPQQ
ncbi:DUF4019 domain-containing protein [Sphingomonas sp. R86520]|uniref:DUF4019 domain-containing protein n=1 Tax=Sphingomonas sp. R86520 TaxID=3093859 RepID=UPI0036D2E29A